MLLVVMLVFGARRIPEIGASLGQGIREFKRGLRAEGGGGESSGAVPPSSPLSTRAAEPPGGEPKRLSQ